MSATELARAAVQQLVDHSIRDVVLSPGSRNAPLSFALRAAERADLLRLHVRIDERTAGFLALGLAKGSGVPVAVCATSGTAIANLHPAVVEADLSRTPLLVLSANRPLALQGTGANQTIDQVGIFASAARSVVHVADDQPDSWEPSIRDALDSLYSSELGPGPVQLDLGLAMPLVPPEVGAWAPSPVGMERPRASDSPEMDASSVVLDVNPRTLVVVGECRPNLARSAIEAATRLGLPVHVEAGSSLSSASPDCLQAGNFLLRSQELLGSAAPSQVVIVGRPTLGRQIGALIGSSGITATFVHDHAGFPNPMGRGVPPILTQRLRLRATPDAEFVAAWRRADAAAREQVQQETDFDAGRAAAAVSEAAASGVLIVASSNPIRDVDERAARVGQHIVVNRGAAGIDGLVSTAVGAALAAQRDDPGTRAVALLGDLAFLHDSTGLVIGPDEPSPDLTIVVLNNDGGAIFAGLEQGDPAYAEDFERVFGTPHGIDLPALCAATGTPYRRAGTESDLRAALANPPGGIDVVEVRLDRRRERASRADFRSRVLAAITGTCQPAT